MRSKQPTWLLAMVLLMTSLVVVVVVLVTQSPSVVRAEPAQAQSYQLPFMRRNHSLVYDPDNQRLILFGGWNGRRFFNDVWALDLTLGSETWYQIHPLGVPPPPRAWHAVVVDTFHDRMLVVAGRGYGGDLDDAWALDLTLGSEAWTELDPAGGFSPRYSVAADYFESPRDMFLFGGMSEGELLDEMVFLHSDTFAGNESWYRALYTGTPPSARIGATAVWDAENERLIVFGGADASGNTNEVYVYDPLASPDTWTQLDPVSYPSLPPPRRFHSAVFYHDDEGDEAMLVYGGLGNSGFLDDVWKLRLIPGAEMWEKISTTGGPLAGRAGHAATVDPVSNRMYLVGGFGPYQWSHNQEWSLDLETNIWQQLTADYEWPGVNVTLSVEDAREGVVVHKLPESMLAVAVKLSSDYVEISENLAVTLTVHGDVLDLINVRVRVSEADLGLLVVPNELGGQYQVSGVDLLQHGNAYQRQVVFYFYLPYDVVLGYVPLTAEVKVPGYDATWQTTGIVQVSDYAEGLVVANRSLLYERYEEGAVSDLLAAAYEAAQGGRRNDNPTGVVIYMDRYTTVGQWDNAAVDYTSPATANGQATEVRDAIRTFYSRGGAPEYLLIVGDDDVIPFYRHYDPTGDEGLTLHDCDGVLPCEHPGWCEDSDTNPAIRATDQNYYFTDDFYADMEGDDWIEGEVELATGRIVGETAVDMLSLLQRGSASGQPTTGRVAMFSTDGYQLGLLPVGPMPDAIPNVLNVPDRFVERGFEVRNDEEVPRTIDVIDPDWGWQEKNAIMEEGFDLYFEGGAGTGYHGTWHRYPAWRIDTDEPVVILGGSHAGLSVPSPEGGVDDDQVQSLARAGASAIVGPTGSAYGSVYDLDHCVMAELFTQRLFDELLSPATGQTAALGIALQQAKQSYPFDVGNLCGYETGQDEKTVTEYVLYGVPWQTVRYPGEEQRRSFDAISAMTWDARRSIGQTDTGSYSQTFTAEFTYTVTVSNGWDILTVPGTHLDASAGYPLLPTGEAYTLCLPEGATVTGLQVVSDSAVSIGSYNIPNVQMLPWELGGMGYTTTAAVDTLYPSVVVTGERRGQLFVVRVMPVQHNPSTGETIFHDRLEVRLTYTASTPVVMCAFRPNSLRYLPGQTMGTRALVQHVGDTDVVLTPTLAIGDPLSRTWSLHAGVPLTLVAGSAAVLPMTATVPLEEGAYRAVFSVWEGGSRSAMAARGFSVVGGTILDLKRSQPPQPQQPSQFRVTFANPWPSPTFAFVNLAILNVSGHNIGDLSPQVIAVNGMSTGTATFDWSPAHLPSGGYTAAAWVTARGQVYGPLSRSFRTTSVYLPLILCQSP
jgi:hypothetical protein